MTSMRTTFSCVILTLSALLLISEPNPPATEALTIQQIADGLDSPVAITHAGDNRLFITEQSGHVRVFDGTNVLTTDFLDISSLVLYDGEQGLLSVAFHPQYASNGYFYVNYTRQPDGATVVARYTVSLDDPNIADPDSATVLLVIPQPYANHNGGQLQFGPDGFLYIGMGDGGNGGDPHGYGQSLATLLGKMLRIDVDHGSPYAIPPTNPFLSAPGAKPEIWAYGFRNPWRFSFDRQTGDLYIGDVGQFCWEEIDFQPANSSGGENYGWNRMEGKKCYDPARGCSPPPVCEDPTLTKPILAYGHGERTEDNCAVTGGYRYRGTQVSELSGRYVYGDYCSGRIWAAAQIGGEWTTTELLNTGSNISAFGEDKTGELYFADLSAGTISRIGCTTSGLPFSDDFEDNDIATWSQSTGTWNAVNGKLTSTTAGEAEILAPASVSGCSPLTIEADLQVATPGASASLLGWDREGVDYVELTLMQGKNRWELQQVRGGKRVAKKSFSQVIDPGVYYHVKITHDGSRFQVFIGGSSTPAVTMNSKGPASGGVGFRVKAAKKTPGTAYFEQISVY